ncbi:protein sel-1 homolog 3 [Aulostomus maculatus]
MSSLPLYIYICWFSFSLQIVGGLDTVTLLNPPEEPVPDHLLEIFYSCDRPSTLQLDCVVSFDTGTISTLQLQQWSCVPSDPRVRTLRLILPDWLVYQSDEIVPESQWVLSCFLRASVSYTDDPKGRVAAQDLAILQTKPSFARPVKQHQVCFAWSSRMLQLTQQLSDKQCPLEEETVQLLSSIYASTGENFGITKTLESYNNEALEHLRVKSMSFPWCMFSIWIFATRHCQENMCGVLHHVGSHDNYVTPTLLLTKSGHLHVQITGDFEESTAFLSTFKVPLSEWCQLTLMLQGRRAAVSMLCIDKEQRTVHSTEYMLRHIIVLDDTKGYFVVGGGRYVRGVEGYFGPSVYYRNRVLPPSLSEAVIPDVIKNVNLTGWLQTCHKFNLQMNSKIHLYSLKARQSREPGGCFDVFRDWMVKDRQPSKCEPWEEAVPHSRYATQITKLLVLKHGGRGVSLPAVGRALYSLSLHKVSRASSTGVFSRILPLLLQAGCLADSRALHMASFLYSTGLGVRKHTHKAWLLALLAAQKDDRLALLHLGHLHHRGLHGVHADPDVAYAYYANIAKQTTLDRHNPSPQQTFVEAIYLNNEEVLKLQTEENHHIFQWLKLQARTGAAEAEQAIARMLFWGQQGVSPNIQRAVRHYERGAVHLEDPTSMYDYGIVLLQGHGVERDIPKAVTFLKKAMEQGFVPAINALAWYYEQFEKDYERAVQLWEQADLLGNPDAALNLGVFYSRGLYPGKDADQYMAYKYYMKAAERGNIRGAIQIADIWTTGIPGYVDRRPTHAVLWAKWAAEHNGYLGRILRRALDSYLRSDMLSSLFSYMMSAEMGFAAAQFNAAYLCDQNKGGFLDPAFASHCMKRYYNLTIQSQNPSTYALIRMGDLCYDGQLDGRRDLFSAAQMYKLAALWNEPQGWYNLGLLAKEGYKLPLSVLIELGLSELYLADSTTLQSALYKRCRDSEDTDSYLPCSLALFSLYLQLFQKDYSAAIKFSTAVAVVAAPAMLFIILGVLRIRSLSLN